MCKKLTFFCLIAALAAYGCSDSPASPSSGTSSTTGGTTIGGTLTATIDGVPFVASVVAVTPPSFVGGALQFGGNSGGAVNGTSLAIFAPRQVGTWAVGGTGGTTVGAGLTIFSGGVATDYNASSGSVTVTSLSATGGVGTFAFVMSRSGVNKAVTNGVFNVF